MSTLVHRPIEWKDAEPLYVMRLDPESVRWSLSDPPDWINHLRWLNTQLTEHPGQAYVGIRPDELPVTVITVNDDRFIDITVNPACRRCGHGSMSVRWAQSRFGGPLKAMVKVGNTASLKLFHSCGFGIVAAHAEKPCIVMGWK